MSDLESALARIRDLEAECAALKVRAEKAEAACEVWRQAVRQAGIEREKAKAEARRIESGTMDDRYEIEHLKVRIAELEKPEG